MSAPDPTLGQRAFISGKVVLDDGSRIYRGGHDPDDLSWPPANRSSHRFPRRFQLRIRRSGFGRAGGHQRSRRRFVLEPGVPRAAAAGIFAIARCRRSFPASLRRPSTWPARCLPSKPPTSAGWCLHRMGQVEGLTISATSAMAPKDAQKAFEKGREKSAKQKFDEARAAVRKSGSDLSQVCGCLV